MAGTVARVASSMVRLNVIPFGGGAGAEIFSVMLRVNPVGTWSGFGVKVAVTVTVTARESGANPLALASIVVLPMRAPVT